MSPSRHSGVRLSFVAVLVVLAFVAGLEVGVRRHASVTTISANDNLVINVSPLHSGKQ